MKNNERRASFFLKLLILRARHRPGTNRLVVRLHCPRTPAPLIETVPIRQRFFSAN